MAKGWNIWGIQSVTLDHAGSWDSDNGTSHLEVRLALHTAGGNHILELDYDYLGTERGQLAVFKLTGVHGYSDFPFLEFAIRDRMGMLAYHEKQESAVQQPAAQPSTPEQALITGFKDWLAQTHAALWNAVASQAVTPNPALTDASFAHLAPQAG